MTLIATRGISWSGSKPEKLNESKCFPLCPRKQTSPYARGMSVSCHKRKSRIVVDLALEQRQQLMLGSVQIAGAGARFSPHDQIERRQAQSRCADVDKRQAAPPGADCSEINRRCPNRF